jgi:hypothetical protein
MKGDGLGHRPEESPLDRTKAVRSDDDQVRPPLVGLVEDGIDRMAVQDLARDRDARRPRESLNGATNAGGSTLSVCRGRFDVCGGNHELGIRQRGHARVNDGEHLHLRALGPGPHRDAFDGTVAARRAVNREQDSERARAAMPKRRDVLLNGQQSMKRPRPRRRHMDLVNRDIDEDRQHGNSENADEEDRGCRHHRLALIMRTYVAKARIEGTQSPTKSPSSRCPLNQRWIDVTNATPTDENTM